MFSLPFVQVEYLNGAVVALGDEYGVPTPANRRVLETVESLPSMLALNTILVSSYYCYFTRGSNEKHHPTLIMRLFCTLSQTHTQPPLLVSG
jgi:hypothetical protein